MSSNFSLKINLPLLIWPLILSNPLSIFLPFSIGMILPLLHLIVDSNTNDQKVVFVNELIMSLKNYIGIDNLLFAFLI